MAEAKRLDERGRCCGRKPMVYKRPDHQLFCPRCDASFNPETGIQWQNWAYRAVGDGLEPTSPYVGTDR